MAAARRGEGGGKKPGPPPVASRSIDSGTFIGEIVERTGAPVMPTQTSTATTRTKACKFKRPR